MRICVFGAASPTIDKKYIDRVEELGAEMARRGHSLVFGGGAKGLMGAVARGVKSQGGYVLGVVPRFFEEEEIESLFSDCDKRIETDTMRERKQTMEDNCDAFIVVPGGIGTYEEFFEILTLKQLCRHTKPIAIYNLQGYYNEVLTALDEATKKGFIRGGCKDLVFVSEDLGEMMAYVEQTDIKPYTVKDLKDG